jgi:hypothetical protein
MQLTVVASCVLFLSLVKVVDSKAAFDVPDLKAQLVKVVDPKAAFAVPDLKAQFTAFNSNYTAELDDLTDSLRKAYAAFIELVQKCPRANTTCAIQRFTECKLQIATTANFSLGWTILEEIQMLLRSPAADWPDDGQSPVFTSAPPTASRCTTRLYDCPGPALAACDNFW